MSSNTQQVTFEPLLEQWLAQNDWWGEFTRDHNGDLQLRTEVHINDQPYDLWLHASDRSGILSLYIYAPFRARTASRAEALNLTNRLNVSIRQGRFAITNCGRIQYSHSVDFETVTPTVNALQLIVAPGIDYCAYYEEAIAAVTLMSQGAEEALRQLEVSDTAANNSSGPQPALGIPAETLH
jgi:hypothetical protein